MSYRIRQRKNGTLEVDIITRTATGECIRERRRSPVTGKDATRRWAEQRERELALRGKPKPVAEPTRQTVPTLREFSIEYLAHARARSKPKTVDVREQQLRTSLLPWFGDTPLDQIDARALARFTSARAGDFKKLRSSSKTSTQRVAPRTVNAELALLSSMLRTAAKWGIIESAPQVERLRATDKPIAFLTEDEVAHFLAAAEKHRGWHLWMLVALRTGLRRGEMLALRWSCVDFDRQHVLVSRNYSERGGFGSPKGNRSRVVPLASDVFRELLERRGEPDALVFPNRDGGPLSRASVACAVRRVCDLAGLTRVNVHALRHTFASLAVQKGVPLRQVGEWLGHASIQQTLVYSHFAPSFGADAIERLVPSSGLRLVARGALVDCPSDEQPVTPKKRTKSRA